MTDTRVLLQRSMGSVPRTSAEAVLEMLYEEFLATLGSMREANLNPISIGAEVGEGTQNPDGSKGVVTMTVNQLQRDRLTTFVSRLLQLLSLMNETTRRHPCVLRSPEFLDPIPDLLTRRSLGSIIDLMVILPEST